MCELSILPIGAIFDFTFKHVHRFTTNVHMLSSTFGVMRLIWTKFTFPLLLFRSRGWGSGRRNNFFQCWSVDIFHVNSQKHFAWHFIWTGFTMEHCRIFRTFFEVTIHLTFAFCGVRAKIALDFCKDKIKCGFLWKWEFWKKKMWILVKIEFCLEMWITVKITNFWKNVNFV